MEKQVITEEDIQNAKNEADRLERESTLLTASFNAYITLDILKRKLPNNIQEYKKWWLIKRELNNRINYPKP